MTAVNPRRLPGYITSPKTRSLIVVVLIAVFFFYPWKVSGPIAYDASDPHLVYVTTNTGGGAAFDHAAKQVSLQANMMGGPRLDFVSSESSFAFTTDMEIVRQTGAPEGGWPTQSPQLPSAVVLKIWHPASVGQVLLGFRIIDATSGQVFFEVLRDDVTTYNRTIGTYRTGELFHLASSWNRLASVAIVLSNDTGFSFSWSSLNATNIPGVAELVARPIIDVSVFPEGEGFVSAVMFYKPTYYFPGAGRFASFVGDINPLLASVGISVAIIALQWPDEKRLVRKIRKFFLDRSSGFPYGLKNHWAALTILVLIGLTYGLVAISFGGLPFDSIVFKTWVYGAQTGGVQGIYGHTSSVGDAFIRPDQSPWSSLGFAYLPLAAYFILTISQLVPSLATYSNQLAMFQSSPLEAQIKFLLGFCTLIAGGVLYAIVIRDTGKKKRALMAMTLFLLNPAIIYDSVIWGETDAVLYLVFLVFAWFAARRPSLALTIFPLFLAFKQTGVILVYPAALLAFMPGWKLRDWLTTWGKGASILFVGLIPLLVGGVLPSTLFVPLIQKLLDVGTPLGAFAQSLTADTYTVWTAFTGLLGLSGIDRLHVSATAPVIIGIPFNLLGYAVFVSLLVFPFRFLRARISKVDPSFWYATMAFVPLALTTLLAGAASRYYTLAIPGLVGVLALGWDRLSLTEKRLATATAILASAISLWTMAGIFTWIESHDNQRIRGLDPSQNPFMAFVNRFYLDNTVITLGSLGAIAVLCFSTYLVMSLARPRPIISTNLRQKANS